jgi:hypothetical protein
MGLSLCTLACVQRFNQGLSKRVLRVAVFEKWIQTPIRITPSHTSAVFYGKASSSLTSQIRSDLGGDTPTLVVPVYWLRLARESMLSVLSC